MEAPEPTAQQTEAEKDEVMLLQGSIQRFNLVGVLRYLAQSAATGVLEVRDFEEYGFIYLVDGRVQGISLPLTDERLGTRLLKAGCLSERQLSDALRDSRQLYRSKDDNAKTHLEASL